MEAIRHFHLWTVAGAFINELLDSSELALEEDIASEVERLDEQFRAPGTS